MPIEIICLFFNVQNFTWSLLPVLFPPLMIILLLCCVMGYRLQQNWKIKRHRLMAAASGNEGFYLDLFDNSLYDSAALFRPSALSTIPVEHDKAGMLAVNLPRKSCHILQFDLLGYGTAYNSRKSSMTQAKAVNEVSKEFEREHVSDDERVREIHSTLREVHRSIHDEQVSTFWYLFLIKFTYNILKMGHILM